MSAEGGTARASPAWDAADWAEAEYDELLDDGLGAGSLALQEVAEQTTYGEIFLADLISRQLRLSLSVAAVYLLLLGSLPLANLFLPELVALPILGLPFGWLVLAILIYPLLWVLARYYATAAREYEDEFTDLVR